MSKVPYYLPETKEEDTKYVSWFQSEREKELFRKYCLNYTHFFTGLKKIPVEDLIYFVNKCRNNLSFKLSDKDVIDTSLYLELVFSQTEE
jgi:hypothetical protein